MSAIALILWNSETILLKLLQSPTSVSSILYNQEKPEGIPFHKENVMFFTASIQLNQCTFTNQKSNVAIWYMYH